MVCQPLTEELLIRTRFPSARNYMASKDQYETQEVTLQSQPFIQSIPFESGVAQNCLERGLYIIESY